MKKQGWILSGLDAGLEIYETRLSENETRFSRLTTYVEARDSAIKQLQEHVQPYLDKIAELQNDSFKVPNRLPTCKAWFQRHSTGVKTSVCRVVAAKTKKRAIELAGISRYEFDNAFDDCLGNWWFHLAQEEGIWVSDYNSALEEKEKFVRPLSSVEACIIAEEMKERCRTIPFDGLLSMLGEEIVEEGESTLGTPYTVRVHIFPNESETRVRVNIDVTDDLYHGGRFYETLNREIPSLAEVDWVKEGF